MLTEPAHIAALERAQGGEQLPQELQARPATVRHAAGDLERWQ